jgi:hypothetical protein
MMTEADEGCSRADFPEDSIAEQSQPFVHGGIDQESVKTRHLSDLCHCTTNIDMRQISPLIPDLSHDPGLDQRTNFPMLDHGFLSFPLLGSSLA